jgi:hypothetical protein
MEHPFEDSAKLRIINAKYTIPETDRTYTEFHHLIGKKNVLMCCVFVSNCGTTNDMYTPNCKIVVRFKI